MTSKKITFVEDYVMKNNLLQIRVYWEIGRVLIVELVEARLAKLD